MKKSHVALVVVLGVCALSGCTNYVRQYDNNTLIVKKNGSLVEVAVENFKDSSVGKDDISSYVSEQVKEYNDNAGKKKIRKKKINTDDMEKVKLVLTYADMESYDEFNQMDYKLVKASELKESDLEGTFTDTENKELKTAEVLANQDANVLIVSGQTDVDIKGEIVSYNNEVTVKNGVATTTGKKNAIIVFK